MMDLKEIQELIKMVSKSGLAELKLKRGDFELVLKAESINKDKAAAGGPVLHPHHIPAHLAPVAPAQVEKPAELASPAPEPKAEANYLEVKSPMVGTFYRSPSPDKPPYIKVGDAIKPGQVVCMVEAMKLFNEIESELAGTIVKILVEDAAPVEYDQVLFLVEPA